LLGIFLSDIIVELENREPSQQNSIRVENVGVR